MKVFKKQLRNAKTVVAQLRAGEWEFVYNEITNRCLTAKRNGRVLWVANGPFFCDVDDRNTFGMLLRHYVWWAAARKATKEADEMCVKPPEEYIPDLYLEE